ncbi:MAG TPA: AAA family ATPase [Candidatus Saccharimonadales bacterium]
MKNEVKFGSLRARKARLRHLLGGPLQILFGMISALALMASLYFLFVEKLPRVGYGFASVACAMTMLQFWHHFGLQKLPPVTPAKTLDDIIEPNLLAYLKRPLTPKNLWEAALKLPEGQFILHRLLLPPQIIHDQIGERESDLPAVWEQASALIHQDKPPQIHAGIITASIILTSRAGQDFLTQSKLQPKDVIEVLDWLERRLTYINAPKLNFGGIGRDWATGFTPTLEHFGSNMSQAIEHHGGFAHHYSHGDLLDGIVSNLERGSSVALIGPEGSGKTTLVYGLAERLLQGRDRNLQYYQIVSLNASMITSQPQEHLEELMLTLFGEGIAAGNIILFLDDAQLFFNAGVGSFDMSQILLPILKNRQLKLVAAFSPGAWQQLQAERPALATSMASITLTEPDQQSVFEIMEDTVAVQESQSGVTIGFEAIKEAYRLSGQYMQDQAYPGKAINLIEQAIPYANHQIITAEAVQQAVEKTKGVKVSTAAAPEAQILLSLEDRIHERMINQKRAVNVVASALRRGRAGVSNPNRPVGSFLFLGPTGVGKTELARSLAATYFGDERQMIRLDMSEYQTINRLLSADTREGQSLLLSIREQPFSVVLLDEIEKTSPEILNLMLQMLDEGQLTDTLGRPASFRSSIIIATSNAGAADIMARVRETGNLDDYERPLLNKLISEGQFKPELLNRFDEVVLFRPLTEEESADVAKVMLAGVNKTLAVQQISVQLTPEALREVVHRGYDPEFGARPMRRIIQKTVENAIAVKILRGEVQPGAVITLDVPDLDIEH